MIWCLTTRNVTGRKRLFCKFASKKRGGKLPSLQKPRLALEVEAPVPKLQQPFLLSLERSKILSAGCALLGTAVRWLQPSVLPLGDSGVKLGSISKATEILGLWLLSDKKDFLNSWAVRFRSCRWSTLVLLWKTFCFPVSEQPLCQALSQAVTRRAFTTMSVLRVPGILSFICIW